MPATIISPWGVKRAKRKEELTIREVWPLGSCALCASLIMANESWHANGFRLVHLRCEYREHVASRDGSVQHPG
jgi:hypothetical protein